LLKKDILNDQKMIVATLQFPDSSRIKTADQPIIYPDLKLTYTLKVSACEEGFKIVIDLDTPLPQAWVGKVGFNLELFPGLLFGKTYFMDDHSGVFPVYPHSPVEADEEGEYEAVPLAEGKELIVAPEDEYLKMRIVNPQGTLQLIDGRVKHNNGWFVVRSLIPENVTHKAIEWIIKPHVINDWMYGPVVHTSQVGYHINQNKYAVIELDKRDASREKVHIKKIHPEKGFSTVLSVNPMTCKDFLRFRYLKADFTQIREPGMYVVHYGDAVSEVFKIGNDVYTQGVWQPTLEYFLPIQMCHMKVFEKYRVWHDRCHLDDALMAPANINHFDVYTHGEIPSGYTALKHVEGLNQGGWHDAGDYDIRVESQFGTILTLAYAFEEFDVNHDQTLISQKEKLVEIHHPDGKPDILQQIEHGLLSVLGGYREFGQFYRGILCPTLRQYALLGEAADMTDNQVFQGKLENTYEGFWYDKVSNQYSKHFSPQKNRETDKEYVKDLDDRLVFMEKNPFTALSGVCALAAASRVLQDYNDGLSQECIQTAEEVWHTYDSREGKWVAGPKIRALAELILTTGKQEYIEALLDLEPAIVNNIQRVGWTLGRVMPLIEDESFITSVNQAIVQVKKQIDAACRENPFGIPYHPEIWGAGWGIQRFGFQHYFLYQGWPELFTKEPVLNALNFVLGAHPGENTASFASNVGTKSQLVAYGFNRAEWSFIPGGVCSGTNLVRPDLPELKVWPYLWQQSEYVMGGGATHFMFLALAAEHLFNN
ncbi:MAG: glycoside hydrolase family 9 protein, partial [bacterium]